MANTSYQNNIRTTTIGGWSFGFDARTEWSSVSRTNNSITINGLRTRMRVNSSSVGASFSGVGVEVHTDVPNGTRRRNSNLGSGTYTRGSSYLGSSGNYSMNVGATATGISSRSGVNVNGGTGWTGSQNIPIPAAGVPSGLTRTATSIAHDAATLGASVSNWGANCTAGSGQRIEYKKNSDGSWTNLAYSTSTSHTRNVTNLTPNTRYNVRSYVSNGAGRTATSSALDFVTLANATETSKNITATSADFLLAVAQGVRTTAGFVQYRKQGESAWIDSSTEAGATPSVGISGLSPNTTYEYRLAVTTSDGTWTGGTLTFTTLPAVKLIYPDGQVKDAVPAIVQPDGSVIMVDIKLIT